MKRHALALVLNYNGIKSVFMKKTFAVNALILLLYYVLIQLAF